MSKEAKYQIKINIEADCKPRESLILDLLAAVFSWADRHEKIKLGSRCLLPHTCGDLAGQWVGWPAPRHVERQGRYWGAAMLGRRAGGRKWPGEWRGPSSKGVIDVYALCNLTSPLHYIDDVNKPMAFLPFPFPLPEQPPKSRHFRFRVRRALVVYIFITILEKNENTTKDFLSEMNRAFHCRQVVWSVWAERRISATPLQHTIALSLFFT